MRQTMLLYAHFTPKVDFTRKFNHHQSFLYEWRLTARTIRKFRIGHQYESNLESDVRFEIESNYEASQVPNFSLIGNFQNNKNLEHRWFFGLKYVYPTKPVTGTVTQILFL